MAVHEARIYWHRDLPPRDAELIGAHTMEATSDRMPGTLEHRDELWGRCYRELMDHARARLESTTSCIGDSRRTND